MSTAPVTVVGGGGHAKVVIATLQAAGRVVAEALDDDRHLWGTRLCGVPVAGPVALLAERENPAVLGIGRNRIRQVLAARYPRTLWLAVRHPAAWIHESVILGAGTVVFAGAVLQPGTIVGAHVIINTGATVDHDCLLGDYVHVAPGTNLAGGVTLEEGAFLGIGSAAIPGARVGAWATVGAGGVVIQPIAPGVTAVGVPARPLPSRSAP